MKVRQLKEKLKVWRNNLKEDKTIIKKTEDHKRVHSSIEGSRLNPLGETS